MKMQVISSRIFVLPGAGYFGFKKLHMRHSNEREQF